jgi:hypothetical protein
MDSDAGPRGGWPRLYAIVVGMLVVEIALLWLLAVVFQ